MVSATCRSQVWFYPPRQTQTSSEERAATSPRAEILSRMCAVLCAISFIFRGCLYEYGRNCDVLSVKHNVSIYTCAQRLKPARWRNKDVWRSRLYRAPDVETGFWLDWLNDAAAQPQVANARLLDFAVSLFEDAAPARVHINNRERRWRYGWLLPRERCPDSGGNRRR